MDLGKKIDDVVGVFSPRMKKQRMKDRAIIKQAEKMETIFFNKGYSEQGASRTKKSLIGMKSNSGTADEDIGENHELLVKRSRSLFQGSTVAHAALRNVTTNTVGMGLKPKPSIDYEYLGLSEDQKEEMEKIIEQQYALWTKDCGYFKGESFEELQNLVMLSQLMSGDVFILLPVDKDSNLKLRLVEADQVGGGLAVSDKDIKNGVELDNGRIVAYHIKTKDMKTQRIELRGKTSKKRNILHIMQAERPIQRRGVPYLSHVIEDLKQLDRYQKAELDAAVIQSYLTVFIETPDIEEPLGAPQIPLEEQVDSQDEGTYELGQGSVNIMNQGEKISTVNPGRQNSSFESFITAICRNIGAALEIPFESLLKKFDSSYSASRAALLELWKMIKTKRSFLVNQFCSPVYEEFINLLVYSGKLSYVNKERFMKEALYREALYKAMWYGPTQGQIDPLKEVQSAEKRVAMGITTRSQETMEINGGDWEKNVKQLKKEKDLMDKLGLETVNSNKK